jgi:uncharacterized protein
VPRARLRVSVVGATGLIGRSLVRALRARDDDVVVLSRQRARVDGHDAVRWDPSREALPAAARDGVDAIVNLAGVPLTAGRWSAARRGAIRESRIVTTQAVAAAVGPPGPGVLVNASAVGYYGSAEAPVDEHAPPGADFLASLCVEWEGAAHRADGRARVVCARSGVVLARDGGALPRLVRLARLGVLGRVGSGQQWVPWVHLDDEVAALLHCLDTATVRGPVNVVAPRAVRQAELARSLRRAVRRPPTLPAPAGVVRLAMGEAAALVLTGQRAVPAALDASGFRFAHPTLDEALHDLLARGPGNMAP